MPGDPLQQFYNAIKPTVKGLPDTYADFASQMQDSETSSKLFNALAQSKVVKGLPDNYDDFADGLGLKKKGVTTSPLPDGAASSTNGSQVTPGPVIPNSQNGSDNFIQNTADQIANPPTSTPNTQNTPGPVAQSPVKGTQHFMDYVMGEIAKVHGQPQPTQPP